MPRRFSCRSTIASRSATKSVMASTMVHLRTDKKCLDRGRPFPCRSVDRRDYGLRRLDPGPFTTATWSRCSSAPYAAGYIAERAKTLHASAASSRSAAGTGVVNRGTACRPPRMRRSSPPTSKRADARPGSGPRDQSQTSLFNMPTPIDLPFPDDDLRSGCLSVRRHVLPRQGREVIAEALRTLRAGGCYLLVIWDEVGRNLPDEGRWNGRNRGRPLSR